MISKPTIADVTSDHFRRNDGSRFRFRGRQEGAAETEMELIEVLSFSKVPPGSHVKREEPFSVLFRKTAGPELPQTLQLMLHEDFEHDWIYLSRVQPPLGLDPQESYYEAVFN
jgi:hypothetical protein